MFLAISLKYFLNYQNLLYYQVLFNRQLFPIHREQITAVPYQKLPFWRPKIRRAKQEHFHSLMQYIPSVKAIGHGNSCNNFALLKFQWASIAEMELLRSKPSCTSPFARWVLSFQLLRRSWSWWPAAPVHAKASGQNVQPQLLFIRLCSF